MCPYSTMKNLAVAYHYGCRYEKKVRIRIEVEIPIKTRVNLSKVFKKTDLNLPRTSSMVKKSPFVPRPWINNPDGSAVLKSMWIVDFDFGEVFPLVEANE